MKTIRKRCVDAKQSLCFHRKRCSLDENVFVQTGPRTPDVWTVLHGLPFGSN